MGLNAGGLSAPFSRWARARPAPDISFIRELPMHEFQVLATFAVIAAIYVGIFLAAERIFMKGK